MRSRSLIAYFMGAGLFAVVPYFDSEIPGEGEMGEILITVVRGLVVGATVVLVAGRWWAWSLALASAFAGALADRRRHDAQARPRRRGPLAAQ